VRAKKKAAKVSTRGFAAMDPEKQRELAAMGGKAVQGSKRSFSVNRKLASEAGRKGGMAVPAHKRKFSTDRAFAARVAAKGGANVPPEKRTFAAVPGLAERAGALGGAAPRAVKVAEEPAPVDNVVTSGEAL